MSEIPILFGALLVGHAIADLVLQPDGISFGKRSPLCGKRWRFLALHGACHGFFVSLILSAPLGLAEAVTHALIDRAKGRGWIGMEIDQSLHVACKILWLALYLEGIC